ncbi:MAG: methionyl-tRNA formyltransferase [Solirubrobacteraceae bacterium]
MRIVYLGTSEFAAVVLRRLADSPHRPELVVTRPDRPRGRGRKLSPPPVAEAARELGIALDQPASVNAESAIETIAQARPDAVLVCAFGALITEPLLSRWEMLNVHPSLLPRWRGAAPVERAIMAGDDVTGVSIMRVGEGLDDGPVCAQATVPIEALDTYGTLAARLEELGAELLVQTLDERPPCAPQDEAHATYAHKISPQDRDLMPARTAVELERIVRALTPHVGAYVTLADATSLGVIEARVRPDGGPPEGEVSFHGPVPVLGCASGALELLTVQPPGRRPMSGADYLRGRRR